MTRRIVNDYEKTDQYHVSGFSAGGTCVACRLSGGKVMAMNAEHPKWGGSREGAGRKQGSGTGRKKEFQNSAFFAILTHLFCIC